MQNCQYDKCQLTAVIGETSKQKTVFSVINWQWSNEVEKACDGWWCNDATTLARCATIMMMMMMMMMMKSTKLLMSDIIRFQKTSEDISV